MTAMALGGAAPAFAHPHVWIAMRSDVVFNAKGEVSGIAVEWTFDDGYAQVALDGLDTNGDGVYSQSELEPLTQENLIPILVSRFVVGLGEHTYNPSFYRRQSLRAKRRWVLRQWLRLART